MEDALTAREAAQLLGVSVNTLYSYVSRGIVLPQAPASSGSRRFSRAQVLQVAARRADNKRGGSAAVSAINWGLPVLETAISHIADGQLWLRGRNVLALARDCTLEQVAALLWQAPVPALQPTAGLAAADPLLDALPPLLRAAALLPAWFNNEADRSEADHSGMRPEDGARLLALLAAALFGAPSRRPEGPLHRHVAASLGEQPGAAELVRATLVLLADHELNASTFTARCVASTGAGPAQIVACGLHALSGHRHGGGAGLARHMLEQLMAAPVAADAAARFYAGHPPALAGLSHPLYPDGDPRVHYLMQQLAQTCDHPALDAAQACQRWAAAELGVAPNVDLALAAMELALDWPAGTALRLYALARSVGWMAHAMEQQASGSMIRPRARYIGDPPG